jgi:DNA-binding response OmpR family regulator
MTDSASNSPAANAPALNAQALKALVIEDSSEIAQLLRMHLEDLGLAVHCEADGAAGLKRAQAGGYALVVLDLMLPSMSGLDVLRALRADASQYTPILMLTARASEIDRVVGLELGADDYLAKPFSVAELQARARALLRRAERMRAPGGGEAGQGDAIRLGQLAMDPARREVRLGDKAIALTVKEFDLLLHFAQNPGRVYTRAQLLDAVWGTTLESYEHNVNTHINRLRAKIEADPANPRYVLTVRGVGYRMADPA